MEEKNNNVKKSGLKIIFDIIFKKSLKDNNIKYTEMAFSLLSTIMFWILGYGLLLLSFLVFGFSLYYYICSYNWTDIIGGIIGIVIILLLIFICFIFSVLMIGAAKEQVNNKKAPEKIVPVFSALVSFIALIVSLIALIK